jgi:6-phosphogluconolactonase
MTNNYKRRVFLQSVVGSTTLALTLSGATHSSSTPNVATDDLLVYVGTYTTGKSDGIYIYRLNLASGEFKPVGTVKADNPSYLAIDGRRRFMYAVNEVTEFAGTSSGAVSAFSINQKTGNLRFLNQQPSLGGAPCYLSVDRTNKFVLVANYVGGNVAVLPIQRDGRLGSATDMEQHRGSGANIERQENPHAHSIMLDSANRFAFASDLGTDQIMVYRFDSKSGKLARNSPPWAQVKAGAGPRHFTFHPSGRYAYSINELDSTVAAFAYEKALGVLSDLQTVSALPVNYSGNNSCADIHISPNGKFLYGSNRGHDSIVVFKIDENTGRLNLVEHVQTGGKTPRNFCIDPTGRFLLAGNQNSDTIVTFRIDSASGRLRPTGQVIQVPSPVCLKMIASFS